MTMQYIRKTYGVPAKRGMEVVPKSGANAGRIGYIRSSRDGLLTVVDAARGRYAWWGRYHPDDLIYGPHGFIRAQQQAGQWAFVPAMPPND